MEWKKVHVIETYKFDEELCEEIEWKHWVRCDGRFSFFIHSIRKYTQRNGDVMPIQIEILYNLISINKSRC